MNGVASTSSSTLFARSAGKRHSVSPDLLFVGSDGAPGVHLCSASAPEIRTAERNKETSAAYLESQRTERKYATVDRNLPKCGLLVRMVNQIPSCMQSIPRSLVYTEGHAAVNSSNARVKHFSKGSLTPARALVGSPPRWGHG
jgi:hypothetical protein